MPNNEADLLKNFMIGLSQDRIQAFATAVADDPELAVGLAELDKTYEAMADYATRNGYVFSAEDLHHFTEKSLRRMLSPEAMAHRKRYLERHARGERFNPVAMDEEFDPVLNSADYGEGFNLDRSAILQGEVLAVRQCPEVRVLMSYLLQWFEAVLQVDDLSAVHKTLDDKTFNERGVKAYDDLKFDREVRRLCRDVIAAFGMDPARAVHELPTCRMIRPGVGGLYRRVPTGPVRPHRDTWNAGPQHLINLWGPAMPITRDETLRVLPAYFRKSVDNSTPGHDVCRLHMGLEVGPRIRQSVDMERAVVPTLNVGDVMLFAGHQLHASAPGRDDRTRVNFEFRFYHLDDEDAPYVPPNIDSYGTGDRYLDWFDCDGEPLVNRLAKGLV